MDKEQSMTANRIFSEEALKALETPLSDRIAKAIDGGQLEEAKTLARQMEAESFSLVCLLEDWADILLSYIYKNQGDEVFVESLRDSATALMKPALDQFAKMGFREVVEAWAAIFRAQAGRGLKVVEDDEKVTLIMDPCGSGGRMVKEGYFGPPKNFLKIKKAQDATFGREDFPPYCAHCAVFYHIMPIEWSGVPLPPIEVGQGPGNPCKWHFYKDRKAIPDRYYQQVGKEKLRK